jgi:hypothetical protein
MPRPHCVPRPGGDPLDQQLAERLNAMAADTQSDSTQSLKRVFIELAVWTLGAVLVAAFAIVWLV